MGIFPLPKAPPLMRAALLILAALFILGMLLYAGKWEGMPWAGERYQEPDIKTDTVR